MKTNFTKAADTILEYEWIVLLLIAIPMLFPKPEWTPVMLVIPGLWILRWMREGQPLPSTPLNLPILLLSIMLLVSLWATYSIEFSLPKIGGLIFAIGVFFATVRYSLINLSQVLIFFFACGLAVSGLGLLASNWPSKIPFLSDLIDRLPKVITRIPAAENGIHPNELGGILLLFALPCIWLAWRSTKRCSYDKISFTLWIIATWLGGLLFLTQSRSALLGFAGGIAFFLFVSGRLGKITLVLGFVAISIFILVMGPDELLYFPGLDTSGSATFGQVTISNRLEIWSRAVYALKDFAITGMGIGTFRVIGPLLYPFFYIEPTRDIAHAHNLFFQSGLDFGILGIISITSIWIAISQILIRPVVSGEGKLFLGRMSAHDVVIGLVGGLLGHFMFSLVDAVALGARPGFLLWMALGLCITLYIVLQRKQRIPNPIQL